jgi:hypothetical protein
VCIGYILQSAYIFANKLLGPTVLSNAVAVVVVAVVHERVEDTHMSLLLPTYLCPPKLGCHYVDPVLVEAAWLANRVLTRPSSKATISPTRARRAHRRAAELVEAVVLPALLQMHRRKIAAKRLHRMQQRLPRMQRLQRV